MKQRWYTLRQRSRSVMPVAAVASALWLVGCASNPSAPVEDRSFGVNTADTAPTAVRTPEAASSAGYRVIRGDTLYAIAFKHGVDYRDLAAWNRIVPPYRIYAGQELRLSAPNANASVTAASAAKSNAPPSPVAEHAISSTASSSPTPAQNPHVENVASAPPAAAPTVGFQPVEDATPEPAPPTPAPAAVPAPAPAQTPPPAPVVATKPAVPAPETLTRPAESAAQLSAGGVTWRWPGNGKVVGTYVSGDQTRQGIDIAGKAGDPVQAVADGEVVYSGNGLLGYGELIIVKHNASFLSAYGHNRRRLVQEGDKVRAGQQIAEMGSSASAREELHFEIRKNGKPVNPLDYLPVR
jgi:lipoprotein NlpD